MFESQRAFAIFSIIGGAIICFWGYRLFKVVLGIAGFIAGAALFYHFGAQYTAKMIVLVILAIFGGLIGASLSMAFYYVGLFLLEDFGQVLGPNVHLVKDRFGGDIAADAQHYALRQRRLRFR